MRCYVVLFDPRADKLIEARIQSLAKKAQLPLGLIHSKIDTTNGHRFGIYVTEDTAKKFPQFIVEFPAGEWLDCP